MLYVFVFQHFSQQIVLKGDQQEHGLATFVSFNVCKHKLNRVIWIVYLIGKIQKLPVPYHVLFFRTRKGLQFLETEIP